LPSASGSRRGRSATTKRSASSPAGSGARGSHRVYDDDDVDVERLLELKRLRDLLNVALDELKQLVEAEEARAAIRRRYRATESDAERVSLLDQALPYVDGQIALVRARLAELKRLETELVAKRKQICRAPARAL